MANPSEVLKLLPDLKGLVDPKVELRLSRAFNDLNNIIAQNQIAAQKKIDALQAQVDATKQTTDNVNGLIGILGQPLVGSSSSDPFVQQLASVSGPQSAHLFYSGPSSGGAANPTFRVIVIADLPINIPLSHLETKILNTLTALAEVTTGAPNTNTGYTIIDDNNGHSIKVMTCH